MFRMLAAICFLISALPAAAQDDGGFKFMEVTVLDPDGKPMPEVDVQISIQGMSFPMGVDDEGKVSFNVPSGGNSAVQVGVQHPGFVAQAARWEKGRTPPDTFTIRMKPGVSIGGVVHDEQGNPIEGVKVEGIVIFGNTTAIPGDGTLVPTINGEIATTDAEGRWTFSSAPEEDFGLQIRFTHPDYISDRGYGFRGGTWMELLVGGKIVTLEKGIELNGRVVDPEGNPVVGANLALGNDRFNSDAQKTKSDADGRYAFKNVAPGTAVVTVLSLDWAPDLKVIPAVKDMPQVDFQLQPGQPIRIQLLDAEANPLAGVSVAADTWQGYRTIADLGIPTKTDVDGMWEWDNAPADEIQYDFYVRGRMSLRNQVLLPSSDTHVLTMQPTLVITGTVTDAETGEPIKEFNVIAGIRWEGQSQDYLERWNTEVAREGKFRKELDEPYYRHLVRIEAEGYKPANSRPILSDEGTITIDFKMEKGTGPSGAVLQPDGQPAEGATVIVATPSQSVSLDHGHARNSEESLQATTDEEGRFALPFPDPNYRVVVLHDSGWAELEETQMQGESRIQLKAWGRIEGISLHGDSPQPGETIQANSNQQYEQGRPQIYWNNSVETDASGKFVFDRLKAGAYHVYRSVRYANTGNSWMSAATHSQNVEVAAGETATLQLGGTGRAVTGKFILPAGNQANVVWSMGAVQFNEGQSRPTSSGFFQSIGRAIANATNTSAKPNSTPQQRRNYGAAIQSDGKFQIDDVEPGNYILHLQVYDAMRNQNQNWNPVAQLRVDVTVPEGEESHDLGSFEVEIKQPPAQQDGAIMNGTILVAPAAVPQ